MHGKNKVAKRTDDPQSLQVREIFYTIQGEGPFSGTPAVFIRLSGCNLRCWFCDTEWDDDNDPFLSPDEIMKQIDDQIGLASRPDLVVVTGGEPMRQNLSVLVKGLQDKGHTVQVETAGTLWQDLPGVFFVVSPKTPVVHPRFLSPDAQLIAWKYVLRHGEIFASDGLPSTNPQPSKADAPVARPPAHIRGFQTYLQPCDEGPKERLKNDLNLNAVRESTLMYGHTATVQLHKLLDVE